MTKSNPMLAFGLGPEGMTCGRCDSYSHLDRGTCNHRTANCGRRRQDHSGLYPACAFFKVTCICKRKNNDFTADNPYCHYPHGENRRKPGEG